MTSHSRFRLNCPKHSNKASHQGPPETAPSKRVEAPVTHSVPRACPLLLQITTMFKSSVAEERMTEGQSAAVIAGFSGWLLDAFDFFLVTFCLMSIARDFQQTDAQIALVITLTLVFRPIGGFLFGIMADRYGRRLPLMLNIGVFTIAEVLTAIAPNYATLPVVQSVFGIVMGRNRSAGTSLAMEGAPPRRRGILSGLLQESYAVGNLLAVLCFLFLFRRVGCLSAPRQTVNCRRPAAYLRESYCSPHSLGLPPAWLWSDRCFVPVVLLV
jgi:MFS family permease